MILMMDGIKLLLKLRKSWELISGLETRWILCDLKRTFEKRYLAETMTLGTGGGLVHFQEDLLKGNPECIFLLHCDIVCSFPLLEMLSFHRKHGKEVTVLGKQVRNHTVFFFF